ncbi:DUF3800 domain-containing protein [Corynebacterium accolens]|nr:DUF3800 domain-containing protein [Corynebacterium accolens]WKS57067.1 DUF3800 domain-containing protein [Corynebacterium accolens]
MLLAYIDEIGSTGAFVHPTHKKYSDSPAFGYGGFIIPEENARKFGAFFADRKKNFSSRLSPKIVTPDVGSERGLICFMQRYSKSVRKICVCLGL